MNKLIATMGVEVTPDDTIDLDNPGTLYVGVGGDLCVIHQDQPEEITTLYKSVAVGFFPVAVRRVCDTDTTATNIVVNY